MAKRSATRITEDMKLRLESVGKYKLVTSRWHQLVKDNTSGDNVKRAINEVAPEIAKEFGLFDASVADDGSTERIREKIVDEAERKQAVLAGKKCSLTDAVEWAFVKCSLGSAKVEDAPSDVAWAMYVQFGKSPSFLTDMAKVVFGAVAKREGESVNHGTDGFDGDSEYNVLESLGGGGGAQ